MKITTTGTMVPNVTKTDRIKAERDELEHGGSERFDESYAAQLARERLEVEMVEAIINASNRLAKALRDHPKMTQQDTSGGEVSRDFGK